jgi:hypothetical protein
MQPKYTLLISAMLLMAGCIDIHLERRAAGSEDVEADPRVPWVVMDTWINNPSALDAGPRNPEPTDVHGDAASLADDPRHGVEHPCSTDMDGDGVVDCEDPDADGDGVLDSHDNCLLLANKHQGDLDGDGLGDACDADVDGDGAEGLDDCDDEDPSRFFQAPEVCDGLDNDCDGSVDEGFPNHDDDELADCVDPDDDGDGVYDVSDNCPLYPNLDQGDQDGDGVGDMCDMDADGDMVDAIEDCDDTNPLKHPGLEELCDGLDNDCDGQVDQGFVDTDSDGVSDCIDEDDDNDGWLDGLDNCPIHYNPGQEDKDKDGQGDLCQGDGAQY